MTLTDHARRELELIGLTRDDPEMAESLVKAVEAFAAYGHSGGSHPFAVATLERLLRYEPLSPLTNDPDEWMRIDEDAAGEPNLWQSRRRSEAFSHDGGRTYYLLSEEVDGVRPLHNALNPCEVAMLAAPDAGLEDEP